MSIQYCQTAMGKSLLVTALVDSYQIWDVQGVGGPGQLIRHLHLEHYVQYLAFAWDYQGCDPAQTGSLRLFQQLLSRFVHGIDLST